MRYEVAIPKLGFLSTPLIANVQGIASIPSVRPGRKLGMAPDQPFRRLDGMSEEPIA